MKNLVFRLIIDVLLLLIASITSFMLFLVFPINSCLT